MSKTNSYSTRSNDKPIINLPKSNLNSNPTLFVYKPKVREANEPCEEITFTQHDRSLLKSPKYLNDTIISFFMQHHLDNNVSDETRKKIHVFSSFFFAKIKSIRTKHRAAVNEGKLDNCLPANNCASRWLKGVKIFSKDFLIMPICEKDHWVLVIVCYPSRTPSCRANLIPDDDLHEPVIFVLNSWTKYMPSIKKVVAQFLRTQWKAERNADRSFNVNNVKGRSIKILFPSLPQQKNNYNCGVYMLNYFYCFLNNPREAYLKIFRGKDLIKWFDMHNIEIARERKRMTDIVLKQMAEWQEKKTDSSNEEANLTRFSPDCNPITSIMDDCVEIKTDNNNSVIVINIS